MESTVELTWALILAAARGIVDECLSVRGGGWQTSGGVRNLTPEAAEQAG